MRLSVISLETLSDCPVVLDSLLPSLVERFSEIPWLWVSLVLVPTVLEPDVPVVRVSEVLQFFPSELPEEEPLEEPFDERPRVVPLDAPVVVPRA